MLDIVYCHICYTNISNKPWYLGYDHKFCSLSCRNNFEIEYNYTDNSINLYMQYLYSTLTMIKEKSKIFNKFLPTW